MYDQSEQSLGVHCESQSCGVKTRKDLCVEIQSVTDIIWQYANISILKLLVSFIQKCWNILREGCSLMANL